MEKIKLIKANNALKGITYINYCQNLEMGKEKKCFWIKINSITDFQLITTYYREIGCSHNFFPWGCNKCQQIHLRNDKNTARLFYTIKRSLALSWESMDRVDRESDRKRKLIKDAEGLSKSQTSKKSF